jgi:hypothetical protein
MNRKSMWIIGGGVVVAAVAVVLFLQFASTSDDGKAMARFGVASARAAEPIGHIGTGKCAEAVEQAGNADKYVFAIFFRETNDLLTKCRGFTESARKKINHKSEIIEINVADPSEQDIVNKFGANRAPMPLVLVIAPNGAIMAGLPPSQLTDDSKLVDAIGTPGSEKVIKSLQQKNMVVLCAQSSRTAANADAMRGVESFVKDPKYGSNTAVVKIDPSDPTEAKFLSILNINVNSPVATTTLIAPPGSIIGTFEGATTMDKLVASVQAAAAPKSGCGPAGCGGKPCGPTGGTVSAPQASPLTTRPITTQPQVQSKQIVTNPSTSASAPSTKSTESATKQGK